VKQLSLSAETDKRLCCDKVIAQQRDSRSRHRTEFLLGPDAVLRCVTGTRQMASVMDIPYLDACLIGSHLKAFYTYYPGGRVV
jgi:hypothetical protein